MEDDDAEDRLEEDEDAEDKAMRGSCNPRAVSPQPHCVPLCTSQGRTCHCSNALSWQSRQQPRPQEPTSPWVQVEGPEWPQDGDVREGGGDKPHGERKGSLTLCSQPFNQQHFGSKKADWPQSWKHTCEKRACQLPSPNTLCGTSPYTSMRRLGEKFLLPGCPYS